MKFPTAVCALVTTFICITKGMMLYDDELHPHEGVAIVGIIDLIVSEHLGLTGPIKSEINQSATTDGELTFSDSNPVYYYNGNPVYYYNGSTYANVTQREWQVTIDQNQWATIHGELTLSNSNPVYYNGNFTNANVTQKEWQFTIDEIQINNYTSCPNGCQATIQMGSPVIIGPPSEIKNINKQIGIVNDIIDCDQISNLPEINFILGGRKFSLIGEDYILKTQDETTCVSGFMTTINMKTIKEDSSEWILGVTFVQKLYQILSEGQSSGIYS